MAFQAAAVFEGDSPQRLSSPVTAARQRRIFTGLPGTHPQPSRCLEGGFNYNGSGNLTQDFSQNPKAVVKLACERALISVPNDAIFVLSGKRVSVLFRRRLRRLDRLQGL